MTISFSFDFSLFDCRAFVRILCVCCPRKIRRKYQPTMRSKSQVRIDDLHLHLATATCIYTHLHSHVRIDGMERGPEESIVELPQRRRRAIYHFSLMKIVGRAASPAARRSRRPNRWPWDPLHRHTLRFISFNLKSRVSGENRNGHSHIFLSDAR